MNVYVCRICGLMKDEDTKSSQSMNYCKDCWNHYQRVRRVVVSAGRVCTMDSYKMHRRKKGMPVNGASVRRGRPRRYEEGSAPFKCEADNEIQSLSEQSVDDERVCVKCYRDFLKHQQFVSTLTIDWYIGWHSLVGLDGKPLLERFVATSKSASAFRMRAQQESISNAIEQFGTYDAWVESMTRK